MDYYGMKDKYVKNALFFEKNNYRISIVAQRFISTIYDRINILINENEIITEPQFRASVQEIMTEEFSNLDVFLKGEILTIYNEETDKIAEILKQTIKKGADRYLIEINNTTVLSNVTQDNPFYTTEFTKYKNEMYTNVLRNVNTALIAGYTVKQAQSFIVSTEKLDNMQIGTLSRTIMKNAQNETTQELYKKNKVGYVRYTAILDSRTTSACKDLNGRIFKIDEAPRLPLHYNCRSTYIPILEQQLTTAQKDGESFSEWYERNKNDPDLKNFRFIMKLGV